jgi:hypothetical protein
VEEKINAYARKARGNIISQSSCKKLAGQIKEEYCVSGGGELDYRDYPLGATLLQLNAFEATNLHSNF